MFPWSKPKPTRAELVRQSVAGGVQALLEHVPADTIESVTNKAKDVALHAGEVVSDKLHQATDVVSHTLHDVADRVREVSVHAAEAAPEHLEAARERASALRNTAAEKASLAAGSAATLAASARETVSDRIHSVRGRAAAEVEEAQEQTAEYRDEAEAARERLMAAAEEAREDWSENAADTRDNLVGAALGALAFWKGRAADAVEDIDIPEVTVPDVPREPVEIEVRDSGSKWMWLLVGLAVGAIIMLMFAPASGRRSRAMVKDRIKKLKTGAADAATNASDKAHDLRNRAEGMAHKLDSKLNSDHAADDDVTIANRIKSELGHMDLIQDIERLNINVEFGTVFLRGPVLDAESQAAIEKAVRAMPGVKEVKSEFLTAEEPLDPTLAQ